MDNIRLLVEEHLDWKVKTCLPVIVDRHRLVYNALLINIVGKVVVGLSGLVQQVHEDLVRTNEAGVDERLLNSINHRIRVA